MKVIVFLCAFVLAAWFALRGGPDTFTYTTKT